MRPLTDNGQLIISSRKSNDHCAKLLVADYIILWGLVLIVIINWILEPSLQLSKCHVTLRIVNSEYEVRRIGIEGNLIISEQNIWRLYLFGNPKNIIYLDPCEDYDVIYFVAAARHKLHLDILYAYEWIFQWDASFP